MTGPIVMDLGDFIPEEHEIRFAVSGRKYVVRFSEATVDEVFAMIAADPNGPDPRQNIEKHRRIVTAFLSDHLVEGDRNQLAEDLKAVPYATTQSLSISMLYERIQLRVKKNGPGAAENMSN